MQNSKSYRFISTKTSKIDIREADPVFDGSILHIKERTSFKMILSSFISAYQAVLPFVEEFLGKLSKKQERLLEILELVQVESYFYYSHWLGRPKEDRKKIARALVVKAFYGLTTTRQLIDFLKESQEVRRICGWESKNDIPSESTFSRAADEFADLKLPTRAHEGLIKNYQSEQLVGHISRDSTDIKGREKPARKPKKTEILEQAKLKRGRPKKGTKPKKKEPTRIEKQLKWGLDEMLADLPIVCDIGTKKDSKAHTFHWFGYKLHVDCADGQIPISCILTSASVHDSQAAIPLATMTAKQVTNLYDLMDAAYDVKEIKSHSQSLGHVPIIDSNSRRGGKVEMDPAKANRYNERTTIERVFGRLKDEFGGRFVRVKGHSKVLAHLTFGILVLAADQLLKLAK